MELHLWRTNYVRTLKTNGECYTYHSIHTGDAMFLRAYKRGMLYFSEHTNGGCYSSQSMQTGDAMLLRTYSSNVIILVNCLSQYPY